MRKSIIYIIVLAATLLVKPDGSDIGELRPVELVAVYQEENQVRIETDTGDAGRGRTVAEAIQNLKDTTAGTIFLDTADYLILGESAGDLVEPMREHMKSSVRVCIAVEEVDLGDAAAYLTVHTPEASLGEVKSLTNVEELRIENNRMILSEKSENTT